MRKPSSSSCPTSCRPITPSTNGRWPGRRGSRRNSNGRLKFHDLPERPVGRPAEPAVRRRAQRHHRHGVRAARRDARPLPDRPSSATCRSPGRRPARAARPRRSGMSELAADYLAKEHEGLHILFMAVAKPVVIYSKRADPQARRLQGRQDPLRRRAEPVSARFARRGAAADPAARGAGRARQGHRQGATFPHEAALSYDLGTVAKHATEPGLSHGDLRVRDESGEVQFAACRPQGADRQDYRPGRGRAVRQGSGRRRKNTAATRRSSRACRSTRCPTPISPRSRSGWRRSVEAAIAALEKAGKPATQVLRGIHRSSAAALRTSVQRLD